ncbi:MAG TPA: ATP-binding cassette domain-containing protein [Candidatus Saccharimonadales bacterium]|nr:ATP-binding cassette domain-containing protein [Candidatus Saccharimonadales bacterium]
MNSAKTIIQTHDLAVGYGHRLIWQHASFQIARGEFVALLGPNGAGKTTLIRLLLGMLQPRSGELQVFGREPKRGDRRIGYIPQRRPVDSEIRIEALEFVRLALHGTNWGIDRPRIAHNDRNQALKALEWVDGADLAHRSLGELSGGELQRVFLAQALVGEPELLLLDEPLANLDIRRETQLIRLIANVARAHHIAVILIAHDINPLLPVLDRIMYVVNGSIAAGTVEEIITDNMLSSLYGVPIEVLRDSRGRIAVLGTEEAAHHE